MSFFAEIFRVYVGDIMRYQIHPNIFDLMPYGGAAERKRRKSTPTVARKLQYGRPFLVAHNNRIRMLSNKLGYYTLSHAAHLKRCTLLTEFVRQNLLLQQLVDGCRRPTDAIDDVIVDVVLVETVAPSTAQILNAESNKKAEVDRAENQRQHADRVCGRHGRRTGCGGLLGLES